MKPAPATQSCTKKTLTIAFIQINYYLLELLTLVNALVNQKYVIKLFLKFLFYVEFKFRGCLLFNVKKRAPLMLSINKNGSTRHKYNL